MEALSPAIQSLVKKATGWGTPHTPDNIQKVDGNVCGSRILRSVDVTPPNTDLFPLSEFLAKHTTGSFQLLDEPIKKPFLSKISPNNHTDALEIFKIILLLTTEHDLSDQERYLLIDYICCLSISCRDLRDEVILQVLNQTLHGTVSVPVPPPPPPPGLLASAQSSGANVPPKVNNHVNDKPWILLADCLSCFKPSFNFQNYILNYLSNGVTGSFYKAFCMDKLRQNSSTGEEFQRSYPPCMLERCANRHSSFMVFKCNFSDETAGCGLVTSWMIAQDFASEILMNIKNLPTNHSRGWTVALRDTQGLFECQGGDFVMDLISELEVAPPFFFHPADFLVTKLSTMPAARYIYEEHPHNTQRRRILVDRNNYFYEENNLRISRNISNSSKHGASVVSPNIQGDKHTRTETLQSDVVPTNWIDDVFEGVLNDDINRDANFIANKIKGGTEDQSKPGMPTSHYIQPTQPYMTQSYMPMMVPNPSMMYHSGTSPCPQPSHHLDHLFFQVDPHKRMEANTLRVQLEAKELEKRVLETTLQNEMLKQQLQEFKSFSTSSLQQRRQRHHSTTPCYPQHQITPSNLVQPKNAMKGQSVVKDRVNIEIQSKSDKPILRPSTFQDRTDANLHGNQDEGCFQMTSATNEDTFKKIGKLGKITWPPEGHAKVEEKPYFQPRKLLIDEKKSQNVHFASPSNISTNPPKPPPKIKCSPSGVGQIDNQNKADTGSLNLSCMKKKLEEIFAKGSTSQESMIPVKDSVRRTTKDDTCKSSMTYVGVDWDLEIRKEFFSPREKLEDDTSINLIYRQVVKDGFSKNCARLTDNCFKELRDVFGKLQITSPDVVGPSNETKLVVIEAAKKLPFYFSKIFPMKTNKDNMKVHKLAIGCEGISLLTFTDDLSFDVHRFIKFEEIIKVGLKSKTHITIESVSGNFTFYSPKATEIQNLIEVHKKEKFELQTTLDTFKNNYQEEMAASNSLPLSRQPSNVGSKKHDSSNDGVVMNVHVGNRDILIEILPEMSVADTIEFVCSIINVTSSSSKFEVVLMFERGQMWTSMMKNVSAYSTFMAMFDIPADKVGTDEVAGEGRLVRGAWVTSIDLKKSMPTYLDMLYCQSISDYLCGYYLPITTNIIPASVLEDISVLVAIQSQVERPNSTVFEEGVEKYVPRNMWSMVDMEYLCPLVLVQCKAVRKFKSEKMKILSLEILSKMPLFGSLFFQVSTTDESNDSILAINRHGLYFLDANTNVVVVFHPFKSGISVVVDNASASTKKLVMTIGKDKNGSENPTRISIISRRVEQILALIELYNSIQKYCVLP